MMALFKCGQASSIKIRSHASIRHKYNMI